MCIDCVDYPVCCLSGHCADDEPSEYFQEETAPEDPGNNKELKLSAKKTKMLCRFLQRKSFHYRK